MRFTLAAAVLAAVASASASSIFARQNFPPCADSCVLTPANTFGCSATDNQCLCTNAQFIQATTQCIVNACNSADALSAEQFSQTICEQLGITLTSTPSLTGTGAASSTSSGAASASVTSGSGSASNTASGSAPASSTTAPASSGSATDSAATSGTSSAPASETSTSGAMTIGANALFGAAAVVLSALVL